MSTYATATLWMWSYRKRAIFGAEKNLFICSEISQNLRDDPRYCAIGLECFWSRSRWEIRFIHRNMQQSWMQCGVLHCHEILTQFSLLNSLSNNWWSDSGINIEMNILSTVSRERTEWKKITQQIHQSCHNPIWLTRLNYCNVLPTAYMLISSSFYYANAHSKVNIRNNSKRMYC